MPKNRRYKQSYVKITVYFKTGTKIYKMSPEKKIDFIRSIKKRTDVIKHTIEVIDNYIY